MKKLITLLICLALFGCSTNKYQENYDLGIKYLEQGDYENAIISLNAALEIEPKEEACLALANAYYNLGIKYLEESDDNNAISNLELAVDINPNEDIYVELLNCYLKQNNIEMAKEISNILDSNFGTLYTCVVDILTENYGYEISFSEENIEINGIKLNELLCNDECQVVNAIL